MLLLFWTLYYLLDQSRIRNIKEPTLLWCIPSQMLLFSLYRSEFLPYTIFFLKNICQHFLQSKSTRDSLRFLIKKNYLFLHPFWRIISRIQHSIWRFFFFSMQYFTTISFWLHGFCLWFYLWYLWPWIFFFCFGCSQILEKLPPTDFSRDFSGRREIFLSWSCKLQKEMVSNDNGKFMSKSSD